MAATKGHSQENNNTTATESRERRAEVWDDLRVQLSHSWRQNDFLLIGSSFQFMRCLVIFDKESGTTDFIE